MTLRRALLTRRSDKKVVGPFAMMHWIARKSPHSPTTAPPAACQAWCRLERCPPQNCVAAHWPGSSHACADGARFQPPRGVVAARRCLPTHAGPSPCTVRPGCSAVEARCTHWALNHLGWLMLTGHVMWGVMWGGAVPGSAVECGVGVRRGVALAGGRRLQTLSAVFGHLVWTLMVDSYPNSVSKLTSTATRSVWQCAAGMAVFFGMP